MNTQPWLLKENLGHPFENFIGQCISNDLMIENDTNNSEISVFQTSGSRDDGKDIILTSNVEVELLNHLFLLPKTGKMKIYLECKSSDKGAIDYNKIAGSLNRVREEEADYFVLVTNTTIAPYCYYQLQQSAAQKGIQFVLIDQYKLALYLSMHKITIGEYSTPLYSTKVEMRYQVLTNNYVDAQNCNVFLLIRNYTSENQNMRISLVSNRNWKMDETNEGFCLGPYESVCQNIQVARNYSDGQEKLELVVFTNEYEEKIIAINGVSWDDSFLPPLHGKKHQTIIETMKKTILSDSEFHIFLLHGEAGVGKSRTSQELCSDLKAINVQCETFLVSKRNKSVEKNLYSFLKRKKILIDDKKGNNQTIKDIFENIVTKFRRYVFVIDDIHNAMDEFYENIKSLSRIKLSIPVSLILIGRDDNSAGSSAYYHFLSYVESCNHFIINCQLYPLMPEESYNLIRSILNDIPEQLLKRIHTLSSNLPLYIVQFAEYLLDINLAHVVNRTTIGLQRPGQISSHNYIPLQIEDIYEARFAYLGTISLGDKIQELLLGFSFFGLEFPYSFVMEWEGENTKEAFTYLESHDFFMFSSQNNIRYVHESMYLYFKHLLDRSPSWKKKISGKLIRNNNLIWNSLSQAEKGRAFLWHNDFEEANMCFSSMYPQIRNVTNFSSSPTDLQLYEFLDDIYDLQIQKKRSDISFIQQILLYKAYMALHFFSPAAAIDACNYAESQVLNHNFLDCDSSFIFSIKELKAHSYLNMGLIRNGFDLLQELLGKVLIFPDYADRKTQFDLYDRLASSYSKFNQMELALGYNSLSEKVAFAQDDSRLLALSSITRAKIWTYRDLEESQKYIKKAFIFLSDDPDPRIFCHNKITDMILRFRLKYVEEHDKKSLASQFIPEAQILLEEAQREKYINSILRLHLFIGTLYYLQNNYIAARQFVNTGIDLSVLYGHGTHIWHLYNLRAILDIAMRKNVVTVEKSFETIYQILKQQNLFFLGHCDFTYENIIAITNIALFNRNNEVQLYRKLSLVTSSELSQPCDYNCEKRNCNYVCESQTHSLREQKKKIMENHLVFVNDCWKYDLRDPVTGYYLILS